MFFFRKMPKPQILKKKKTHTYYIKIRMYGKCATKVVIIQMAYWYKIAEMLKNYIGHAESIRKYRLTIIKIENPIGKVS